jgi:hypothetical protein
MVRHLNKRGGSQSLYRGGGSIGIVGACRSAWLIAREPLKPKQRVLAQIKNNLAPPQPSLTFAIAIEETGQVAIKWLGPCEWEADQLLAAAGERVGRITPFQRACAFLAEILEQGPLTSQQIWTLAEERELSKRTLDRAKKKLQIRSARVGKDGQRLSYWLLPHQELPEDLKPKGEDDSLDPWLDRLRAMYPMPTPIDDV